MAKWLCLLGSAAALQTELSDEFFAGLRSSFARAPEAERLQMLNKTMTSVRSLRHSIASRIGETRLNVTNAAHLKSSSYRAKHGIQTAGISALASHDGVEAAQTLSLQECGFTCGWSMFRDLTALARYVTNEQCELRDWVDWWSSGLANLMIDQGEPLHRALLRAGQSFTGVGYGAPYVGQPGNPVQAMWEADHAVVGALVLGKQTDRVVANAVIALRKSFCDYQGLAKDRCPTGAEFVGYALLIECIVTAGLLLGDTSMDPSRRSAEPGPLVNGFYLAAMTASSVGYGDFAPYSAASAYLSPVWMTILVSTFNAWTSGLAVPDNQAESDCDNYNKDDNPFVKSYKKD